MEGQIVWLDGQANFPGNVEKICPGRHIRQNQWRNEWKAMYPSDHDYHYISDYECIFDEPDQLDLYQGRWHNLQAAKQQGTNVSIKSLAHFTRSADAIVVSGGFRGGMKKINKDAEGQDVNAKFSWWSPKFDVNDITEVRNTLGKAIQPFLADEDNITTLKKQFATSDAFCPAQRYGNSYFQYDIDSLCHKYGDPFDGEVQFKILGTFSYKQEVMHAVLVCSQENGAGMFGAYPPVLTPEGDVNNEAVVTRDNNGNWVWKPQATGTEIIRLHQHWKPYPMYRRWDHVAFAFHIPDEWEEDEQLMFVEELEDNLHYI